MTEKEPDFVTLNMLYWLEKYEIALKKIAAFGPAGYYCRTIAENALLETEHEWSQKMAKFEDILGGIVPDGAVGGKGK